MHLVQFIIQTNKCPRTKRVVSDGSVVSVLASARAPSKPPHMGRTPRTMVYLRMYALDMAYTEPPKLAETPRTHKRRAYNTLHTMSMAENSPREMRVTQLRLSVDWALVWKNVHTTWVFEEA